MKHFRAFHYLRNKPSRLFVWAFHKIITWVFVLKDSIEVQSPSFAVSLTKYVFAPAIMDLIFMPMDPSWAYHPFSNAGSKALCCVAHATWLKDMPNHPKYIKVWFLNVCEYLV